MPLTFDRDNDTLTVRLTGDAGIAHIDAIERALAGDAKQVRQINVDTTQLRALGLAPAWILNEYLRAMRERGATVRFVGERPSQFEFIDQLAEQSPPGATASESSDPITKATALVGRMVVAQWLLLRSGLRFGGKVLVTLGRSLLHPKQLRWPSIVRHIYETGFQAVPIVALIAFLITLVIAYIGAQQLEPFGAEIFTVNLVVVGVLREMGVLLTAIIVAGRSGSAFAAEIGVMRLNDEVDALKSIGMDPYQILVVPRVIGLVIALPLLTILADAMGVAGGALLCSWLLDISLPQFISRMQDALAPTTFWAGFLKAPAFAFLIAMTGTYRGMNVRDSSRELGRLTTVAVVQSIFLVILANAVFAIVYLELDF
jgi:phospholipid/cholesterol/gamma-HCH transport system permease protein